MELAKYLYESLSTVPNVRIYGPSPELGRISLCTFNIQGMHPTDLATFLDQQVHHPLIPNLRMQASLSKLLQPLFIQMTGSTVNTECLLQYTSALPRALNGLWKNIVCLNAFGNLYVLRGSKSPVLDNSWTPYCKIVSWTMVHAFDQSLALWQHGIAVRTGHHCAQPLHRYLGINGSIRASLYFYNTIDEIDTFINALKDTIHFFSAF